MNPTIKFNGGKPIVLCKLCRTIIAYIKWNGEKDKYIIPETGGDLPLFCDECDKEITDYVKNNER